MVKSNDILTQINRLLVKAYPDRTVYINLCPKDFARPSFFIECLSENISDVNRSTVQVTGYYTITCYIEVDKYHNSDAEALMAVQDAVLDIFKDGYITVGNRKIKCKSSAGGMDSDAAYVDIQFEYYDDRSDTKETYPIMGMVKIKLQEG